MMVLGDCDYDVVLYALLACHHSSKEMAVICLPCILVYFFLLKTQFLTKYFCRLNLTKKVRSTPGIPFLVLGLLVKKVPKAWGRGATAQLAQEGC